MMKMVNLDLLFADRKKLAVIAVCLCLAFYGDVAYVLGWQMRSIADTKKKIAKANADVENISRDITLMNQAAVAKTVTIRGLDSIPDILREISALATEHSIKILQITPVKSKEIKTMQSQSYLALAIRLDLVGGYHDVGMFLNELERGEHPLFTGEFRISPGDDFLKQRINLNLLTYVKK
jgi:hypothetical protein